MFTAKLLPAYGYCDACEIRCDRPCQCAKTITIVRIHTMTKRVDRLRESRKTIDISNANQAFACKLMLSIIPT